jgi:hypothetical protein
MLLLILAINRFGLPLGQTFLDRREEDMFVIYKLNFPLCLILENSFYLYHYPSPTQI